MSTEIGRSSGSGGLRVEMGFREFSPFPSQPTYTLLQQKIQII